MDDLDPRGRAIIDCCLNKGTVDDYVSLIESTAVR
jgi:hypothetical protein